MLKQKWSRAWSMVVMFYTIEDAMKHYGLTRAEVHASLAYYYEHQTVLDAKFEETQSWLKENALTIEQFQNRNDTQ